MEDKKNEIKLIKSSMVPWLKFHGELPEGVQAKSREFADWKAINTVKRSNNFEILSNWDGRKDPRV